MKQLPLVAEIACDLRLQAHRSGRLAVDPYLRVLPRDLPNAPPMFAFGDCAGDRDQPLPLLAQVASQQAQYLARALNRHGLQGLLALKEDEASRWGFTTVISAR